MKKNLLIILCSACYQLPITAQQTPLRFNEEKVIQFLMEKEKLDISEYDFSDEKLNTYLYNIDRNRNIIPINDIGKALMSMGLTFTNIGFILFIPTESDDVNGFRSAKRSLTYAGIVTVGIAAPLRFLGKENRQKLQLNIELAKERFGELYNTSID